MDYEGTRYCGWQLQPNGPTIQGELERAFAIALREPVRVRGSGRTDAGVHASGQVAAAPITRDPGDLGKLRRSLNALTPDDIAVREIALVGDDFDPRRDARSRRYEYRIWRAPAESPFWRRWAWHVPYPLDLAKMQAAAAMLLGEHDVVAFQGANAQPVESTVRRIAESAFVDAGPQWVFGIEATAFLKNMVRNVVGTLVEIGRGDRPAEAMAEILASRDRTKAGATAPPHGLTLVAVRY